MPLPMNTTLSLLGASRPGDALHSKPKKAMLIRMSSEILDALEASAQPLVQFEFAENPGLYIGDTCFPMIPSQETSMHELYLRAASATKKNAPLKLHANIVGKFTVEQREIGNGLRDKIRESTQDAAAQKNSRATVFMDTPPDTQPVNRKRKDAPMFHKPLRQSDKVKPVPSASASSAPVSKPISTHPPSTSHQGGVPPLKRLVHCLARGEKSEEELFKLLGADRNASLRTQIVELLDQLAELKTDKSSKVYRLKPVGWKEVRPFEWPGLSEQERVQLARNGRLTLKNLRVPESDPLWTHFHYKSPSSNSTSSTDASRSSTSNALTDDKLRQHTAEPPKRGVSSRELKEKKMKPKADPKAEIQMKDESQRALKRPPAESVSDGPRTSTNAPRDNLTTRPSSTRQVKPPVRREIEKGPPPSSTAYSKTSTSHVEKPKPQELKRLRESDVHGSDSERGRGRVKERIPKKELQDDVPIDSKPKLGKNKAIEGDNKDRSTRKLLDEDYYSSSRGSLKRRAREDPETVNPKTQKRRTVEEDSYANVSRPSNPKTRDDDEWTSAKSKASSKRKAETDDDDYEPVRQKKPRHNRDSISSALSSSRDDRQGKEYVSPKKTVQVSRNDGDVRRGEKVPQSASTSKIRKASPPLPTNSSPISRGRDADQRRSSTLSGTSTSKPTKLRRKSPIYTSTEDEKDDDSAQPSVTGLAAPAANNAASTSKAQKARNNASQPLPSDDDLRSRYNGTYLESLSVMQKLLVQKGRLNTLLQNADLDSSGSISDSEGDVELLPPEELEVLTAQHKKLQNELQAMWEAYGRRIKGTSLLD